MGHFIENSKGGALIFFGQGGALFLGPFTVKLWPPVERTLWAKMWPNFLGKKGRTESKNKHEEGGSGHVGGGGGWLSWGISHLPSRALGTPSWRKRAKHKPFWAYSGTKIEGTQHLGPSGIRVTGKPLCQGMKNCPSPKRSQNTPFSQLWPTMACWGGVDQRGWVTGTTPLR